MTAPIIRDKGFAEQLETISKFSYSFLNLIKMLPSSLQPQLPFHEWACLRTELRWVYERAVSRDVWHSDWDRRMGHWAWYVRQGHARIVSASGEYEAAEGEWLFLPREVSHQDFADGTVLLSLHFLCQWPSGENIFANKGGARFDASEAPLLLSMGKRLERLVRRLFPEADVRFTKQRMAYPVFLNFQTYFMRWLHLWFQLQLKYGARLTRLEPGDDRPLRMARCLNEAPLDRGFPREWLREETGLSEVHVSRIFLREFGMTPRRYWEKRRFEFAKICLKTGTAPVKEVGYQLGFRSPSHFVDWFQKHAGASPKTYRLLEKKRQIPA